MNDALEKHLRRENVPTRDLEGDAQARQSARAHVSARRSQPKLADPGGVVVTPSSRRCACCGSIPVPRERGALAPASPGRGFQGSADALRAEGIPCGGAAVRGRRAREAPHQARDHCRRRRAPVERSATRRQDLRRRLPRAFSRSRWSRSTIPRSRAIDHRPLSRRRASARIDIMGSRTSARPSTSSIAGSA